MDNCMNGNFSNAPSVIKEKNATGRRKKRRKLTPKM
jgi:hypothetical protein